MNNYEKIKEMRFKFMRSVDLPYKKQALIWSMCKNFSVQPKEVKVKIVYLCLSIGEEYAAHLFELLTKDRTTLEMSMRVPCDESTLKRKRKLFYEAFAKKFI